MSELEVEFAAASTAVRRLSPRPDNASLLRLYALYKQATQGDAHGETPRFFDAVGTAKHAAWRELRGMAPEEAMQAYVALAMHVCGPPVLPAAPPPCEPDRA